MMLQFDAFIEMLIKKSYGNNTKCVYLPPRNEIYLSTNEVSCVTLNTLRIVLLRSKAKSSENQN